MLSIWKRSSNDIPILKFLVKDDNLMVRMRAIEALALVSGEDPMEGLIEISNESNSRIEILLTMNSIAFFGIIMDFN